jgi:hypothetical protein
MMQAVCSECRTLADCSVGYCACGGIRIIQRRISDEEAGSLLWPPSPLLRSRIPGLKGVFLKYENGHLTGSFKDRIMRLAVADAISAGATGAVVPSSGNGALAAAAAGAASDCPFMQLCR